MTEISDTRFDAAWREANPQAAEKLLEMALGRMKANDYADVHGNNYANDHANKHPNHHPKNEAGTLGPRLQLEARMGHDTCERLTAVSTPVYICAGEHDGIAPPSNQRALAAALPNSRLEFFDGGHLFLIQDRTAFRKIADFLLARS